MAQRACDVCGTTYEHVRASSRYCSGTCRQRAVRAGMTTESTQPRTCTRYCGCGKRVRCQLHVEQPRCHECRRAAWHGTCVECGGAFVRKGGGMFCSMACSNRWHGNARRIRPNDDERVKRAYREANAPGLNRTERDVLRVRWIRQGRMCVYCGNRKADTIDHVLPLVRGGTNYEGNLVPACRACNSGKSGRTMIEWLTGRRLPPVESMPAFRRPVPKPKRKRLGKPVQLQMRLCAECGALHVRNSDYCCGGCQSRYAMRMRYRLKVGIPVDAEPYAVRAASVF